MRGFRQAQDEAAPVPFTVTVANLMRAAPTWTHQERLQVKAVLSELLFESTKTDSIVKVILGVLHAYLKAETGLPGPSNGFILSRKGLPHFFVTQTVETITKFAVACGMQAPLADRDIQVVSTLYFQLIGDWLRKKDEDMTWLALLRNGDIFPALFDSAFPSYFRSGLAPMILKRVALRMDHPVANTKDDDEE